MATPPVNVYQTSAGPPLGRLSSFRRVWLKENCSSNVFEHFFATFFPSLLRLFLATARYHDPLWLRLRKGSSSGFFSILSCQKVKPGIGACERALCQLILRFELQSTSEITKGCIKIAIGQLCNEVPVCNITML